MKKIFLSLFLVLITNAAICQNHTFEAIDENGMSTVFTINTIKKSITWNVGGLFSKSMPYYNYYSEATFTSLCLDKGILAPKVSNLKNYSKSVLVVSDHGIQVILDGDVHFYAPKELMEGMKVKESVKEASQNNDYWVTKYGNKLLALNRSLSGNSKSNTSSTSSSVSSSTTSAKTNIRAIFHGTRVGKISDMKNDGRDLYNLFFQCNVSVYGAKGQQVKLIAYVDGPIRGKGLYAPGGRYKTSEGNVAISKSYDCRSDSEGTQWPQATLTLPFSDLCLSDGTHTINVRWFANLQGKFIGNSEFQTIHFTKHGKEITNFYVDGGEATPGYYD